MNQNRIDILYLITESLELFSILTLVRSSTLRAQAWSTGFAISQVHLRPFILKRIVKNNLNCCGISLLFNGSLMKTQIVIIILCMTLPALYVFFISLA